MKIKLGSGLIPQNLLIILLIIIIIFIPSFTARFILGLPFLLFFPGYSLILALFPKRDQIGGIERVALSFGLSIVIVPVIGLILSYTPLGITLESTLYSITGFLLLTSFIAWLRLIRLDKLERFSVEFHPESRFLGEGKWNRALSFILITLILAAVSFLGYILVMPEVGEEFTEFYVLGLEGEAAGYPSGISAGDEASVILGIMNHENEVLNYRVEIIINAIVYNEAGLINLEDDEKWEDIITFTLDSIGENQKVEFLLFRYDNPEVYRSLYLLIDVVN